MTRSHDRLMEAHRIFNAVHSKMDRIREQRTTRSSQILQIVESIFMPTPMINEATNPQDLYALEEQRIIVFRRLGLTFQPKQHQIEEHMGFHFPSKDFLAEYFRFDVKRLEMLVNKLDTLSAERVQELIHLQWRQELLEKLQTLLDSKSHLSSDKIWKLQKEAGFNIAMIVEILPEYVQEKTISEVVTWLERDMQESFLV